MEDYAQFSVSDWIFKTKENECFVDYINKEQITYGAGGDANVKLYFEIQSDKLKQFLNNSAPKDIELCRARNVRTENGELVELRENFGNIFLVSFCEINEINHVACLELSVSRMIN